MARRVTRPGEALGPAEQLALQLHPRARGARVYLPALLRLRAEVALAVGSEEPLEGARGICLEAGESADAGLAIAGELELRPEEARLRLVRAVLLERQGKASLAAAERAQAEALLAAMDMRPSREG